MSRITIRALVGAAVLLFPLQAQACDLCSIYNVVNASQTSYGTYRLGLAEQFTSFGKVQYNNDYVENKGNQHMESSITQIFSSYDLNERLSFQATLPYINRGFKRIETGRTELGTEAGIGDLTFVAKYTPLKYRDNDRIFSLQLIGGIKFATGESNRIAEEIEEEEEEAHHEEDPSTEHRALVTKHAGVDHEHGNSPESAIHGHDLALGSGSYDFPVGLNVYAENGRVFGTGSLQYIFRTEGSYGYEYADDLNWKGGPGYYLHLGHEYVIALKANLSGEHKSNDNFRGDTASDTGVRSTFIGPEIAVTAGDWTGELGWDIPLDINNSGFQAVPDYRLRAALSYRF